MDFNNFRKRFLKEQPFEQNMSVETPEDILLSLPQEAEISGIPQTLSVPTNLLSHVYGGTPTQPPLPAVVKDEPIVDSKEDLDIKNALQSQLSGLDKEKSLPPIDFGNQQIGNQQHLKELQQQRDKEKSGTDLRKNINLITAGLLQTQPTNEEYFQREYQQAEQPIKDYEQQLANEKNDPNSTHSKGLRNYLNRLGFKITGSPSAVDLEKIVPLAVKQYENKEARIARRKDLQLRLAELNQRMVATKEEKRKVNEEKHAEKLDKRLSDASNRISGELARSNTSLGKASQIKFASDRIDAMVSGVGGDLNKLSNRQLYELAGAVDSLITQGVSTVSGRQHLIPDTFATDTAKIAEYITNQRKGAKAKEFAQEMLKTVAREREVAIKMQKEAAKKILSGYPDIEKHPGYSKMLQSHGLEDSSLEGKIRVEINGQPGFLPKENLQAAKQKYGNNLKVIE